MQGCETRQAPKRASGPVGSRASGAPAAVHQFCLAFGAELPQEISHRLNLNSMRSTLSCTDD